MARWQKCVAMMQRIQKCRTSLDFLRMSGSVTKAWSQRSCQFSIICGHLPWKHPACALPWLQTGKSRARGEKGLGERGHRMMKGVAIRALAQACLIHVKMQLVAPICGPCVGPPFSSHYVLQPGSGGRDAPQCTCQALNGCFDGAPWVVCLRTAAQLWNPLANQCSSTTVMIRPTVLAADAGAQHTTATIPTA